MIGISLKTLVEIVEKQTNNRTDVTLNNMDHPLHSASEQTAATGRL